MVSISAKSVDRAAGRSRTDLGSYEEFLEDIKGRIRSAQARAARAINAELIEVYWQIGSEILRRQQQEGPERGRRTPGVVQRLFNGPARGVPRRTWVLGAQSLSDAVARGRMARRSLRPYERPPLGAYLDAHSYAGSSRAGVVCRACGGLVAGTAASGHCESPARARGGGDHELRERAPGRRRRRCAADHARSGGSRLRAMGDQGESESWIFAISLCTRSTASAMSWIGKLSSVASWL